MIDLIYTNEIILCAQIRIRSTTIDKYRIIIIYLRSKYWRFEWKISCYNNLHFWDLYVLLQSTFRDPKKMRKDGEENANLYLN